MKSISNAPKAPGQIPIENKVFREFGGINTQAARTSIAPEQFSWLENVMPIGAGNLKAVPQKNAALTTLTGKTVYYSKEFNIAGVFYMFYACTDGALFQVKVSDGTQTVIIAAGTYSASGAQIAQWKNERILIIDPTAGYAMWDGTTFYRLSTATTITGTIVATTLTVTASNGWISVGSSLSGGTASGIISAQLSGVAGGVTGTSTWSLTSTAGNNPTTATPGSPTSGTSIATFAGRVWIVNGTASRTISYTDAASFDSFINSGGSTTITDEVLTGQIYQLVPANNFLYIFGGDSINVISDVQVSSGAAVFSNTNISANSGTDLNQAIVVYYRAVWYMNRYGIFALYGSTPRKASDDLDGIFPLIDFTKSVTSGTVVIFNILCAAFMATYNDPVAGARKIIMIYFNKKWFVTSQTGSLTTMATSHGQLDTLYGVDTASIYKLFGNSTLSISQTVQTALWDLGDFIPIKQSLRIGVEGTLPASTGSVTATCDTEFGSQAPEVPFAQSFSMIWYNSSGSVFSWTNSLGAAFAWLIGGYVWFQGDVETTGHYLGMTVTSNTAVNVYNGLQLQYRRLPAGWGN